MKSILKNVLVVYLISMLSTTGVHGQTLSQNTLSKIDSIFNAHFSDEGPGAAFAVIKNGDVVFKKTMGLANVEYQIPISDTSVFNIASNSKQFTSLLAFMLEEEGKLSFDDDIRIHLPELRQLPYKITIRQLTNHTHGLPNVDELAQLKGIDRMTQDEVLEMLFHIEHGNFTPGDDYQYNNTGYVLLSEIITRAGKKSFEEQLREKIFTPLGMSQSQAVGDYTQIIPGKAYSYAYTGSSFVNHPVKISTMGSSGIYASLNDLIIWAKDFTKSDSPNRKYLDKMQKATVLNTGKVIKYGMGIQFEDYKGVDIVFHGGGTEGYRSYLLHAPEHELSLIFISNAGGFSGLDVIYTSLETLLEDFIEDQQLPSEQIDLSAYEGTYELNPGSYFTIWAEKDSLYIKTFGTDQKILLPRIGERTFESPWPYSRLTFYKDRFDLRYADFTYSAKRVTPPIMNNSGIDLNRYIGTYHNTEHNVFYQLVLIDGQLFARHPAHKDIPLDIYSTTSLYANNPFFGRINFLFDAEGKAKGFKLSRQNLTNLIFTKL